MSDISVSILETILDNMESTGQNKNAVIIDVDESLVNSVYDVTGFQYSIKELRDGVSHCLAHEWIENITVEDRFRRLRITTKGVGVAVSSKNRRAEAKKKFSLKRISGYIEERKGIFTFLAFLLSILAILFKIFGEK